MGRATDPTTQPRTQEGVRHTDAHGIPGLCATAVQECRAILGLTRPLSTGSMQGDEGHGEGVSQGLGHGSPGSGCL